MIILLLFKQVNQENRIIKIKKWWKKKLKINNH